MFGTCKTCKAESIELKDTRDELKDMKEAWRQVVHFKCTNGDVGGVHLLLEGTDADHRGLKSLIEDAKHHTQRAERAAEFIGKHHKGSEKHQEAEKLARTANSIVADLLELIHKLENNPDMHKMLLPMMRRALKRLMDTLNPLYPLEQELKTK